MKLAARGLVRLLVTKQSLEAIAVSLAQARVPDIDVSWHPMFPDVLIV
jgi:hypothetical protein